MHRLTGAEPGHSSLLDRPSRVHLPPGPWQTVLDCLCSRFPDISREIWQARMQRGRVLDGQSQPIGIKHPYRAGLLVCYFREVAQEPAIPLREQLLYVDRHLVVADKPHFLPVQPSGQYVRETLLARLCQQLDNPHLVPLHRIDRLTAGLVLFSACPETRGHYQALFRERRIEKTYEAICPPLPELAFPWLQRSRLVASEPFFLMREEAGEPNSETRIDVLEKRPDYWRYALFPVTGRKHQLRVQMAALGAGIRNDPFYPYLQARDKREIPDFQHPLGLLARSLRFSDPLDGRSRHFTSTRQLAW